LPASRGCRDAQRRSTGPRLRMTCTSVNCEPMAPGLRSRFQVLPSVFFQADCRSRCTAGSASSVRS
jgi:hypothetical protein